MATTPELNAAERSAGTTALKGMIAKVLPAWQQALVPENLLIEAVTAVVAAVDKVRDHGTT